MKNKISDVRDHLVAMLESLGNHDADVTTIERAKATALVAGQYIAAVKVEIDAIRLMDDTGRLPISVEAGPVDRPHLRSIPSR